MFSDGSRIFHWSANAKCCKMKSRIFSLRGMGVLVSVHGTSPLEYADNVDLKNSLHVTKSLFWTPDLNDYFSFGKMTDSSLTGAIQNSITICHVS